MVWWLVDSRLWNKSKICTGTQQLLKNTKHEFLHGQAKEPIKMLNVFYARNVIQALFFLKLDLKREKLSNYRKRDKLTGRDRSSLLSFGFDNPEEKVS